MIICPEIKLVFIHIPKTGGTSLTRILAPYTTDRFRTKNPRQKGIGAQGTWHFRGRQHAAYSDLSAELGSIVDEDWRFLTVHRDPYEWLGSMFMDFYARDRNENQGPNFLFGVFSPQRRFSDFFSFYETFSPGYPNFWAFQPQTHWIRGVPDERLIRIDFATFGERIPGVLDDLGIAVPDTLPHALNRGDSKREQIASFREDPRFVPLVNKICAADFERFGYEMLAPASAGGA